MEAHVGLCIRPCTIFCRGRRWITKSIKCSSVLRECFDANQPRHLRKVCWTRRYLVEQDDPASPLDQEETGAKALEMKLGGQEFILDIILVLGQSLRYRLGMFR